LIRSAHDCSEGGLAVTLAECCFDTTTGADVDVAAVIAATSEFGDIATLFGESASRVVISVSPARTVELVALAKSHGIPAAVIGNVGGERIRIAISGRSVIDVPRADAERIWATAIDRCLESRRAIA
jgi:phosphoribosylformylglycinamidine (FGAM) synthase-like enzyme